MLHVRINSWWPATPSSIRLTWSNDPAFVNNVGGLRVDAGMVSANVESPRMPTGNGTFVSTLITNLVPGSRYTLYVRNRSANDEGEARMSVSTSPHSASAFVIEEHLPVGEAQDLVRNLFAEDPGVRLPFPAFHILLPRQNALFHYRWNLNMSPDQPLTPQDVLKVPGGVVQDTEVALIESWQKPGMLEALARVTPNGSTATLVAFQFAPGGRAQSLPVEADGPIDRVTGSPAFIQDEQGLFNLLVPREEGRVFHYIHESQTLAGVWKLSGELPILEEMEIVALGLTQVDSNGGMIAVARARSIRAGVERLFAYSYSPQTGWSAPAPVLSGDQAAVAITGNPTLFASNTSNGQVRLELLVPVKGGVLHIASALVTQGEVPIRGWAPIKLLPVENATPVATSLVQTAPGKLQAFVRALTPQGEDILLVYPYDRVSGWGNPIVLHTTSIRQEDETDSPDDVPSDAVSKTTGAL